jgi:molecular chaperone DnaK
VLSPVEVSAEILKALRARGEAALGKPVTRAVITVPAYFDDAARTATRDAARLAGLEVLRLVNEPTAAALAYGMDKKRGGKVAVFDLGGGTFDVSILEVTVDEEDGNLIHVLSTNGDTFLGGENFDETVTEYLVEKINEEHGTDIDLTSAASRLQNASVIQRIREAAEKAKIDLSREKTVTVSLPFLLQTAEGPVNFEHEMSRAQLEKLLKPFVERTLEPCKKALADAGLSAGDLDEVILVGGQTRMPLVIETVKGFFGREPKRDVNPDEIVALGASVQGAVLEGKVDNVMLLDVTPLSIGVRSKGDVFTIVFPRNTTIPNSISDTFYTAEDNQPNVHIRIAQGERPTFSDNKQLGEFTLELDRTPSRAGREIEVSFAVDADGVLTVSAKDVKSGREQKITVKADGGLSEQEVARMLKDAEANAEADRVLKETRAVDSVLKEAAADRDEDFFKNGPEDLKSKFEKAVADLTAARDGKNAAAMAEKTAELQEIRFQLGEAFNGAAPGNDGTGADEAPAADAAKAPRPPAP